MYIYRQKAKSLIDHAVISNFFFFDKISGLTIKPLTYFSDHCSVVANISIPTGTKDGFSYKPTYKWKKFPNLFHCNKFSTEAYRASVSRKEMKANIPKFLATSFTNNSAEGIEKKKGTLTDIMTDTANIS